MAHIEEAKFCTLVKRAFLSYIIVDAMGPIFTFLSTIDVLDAHLSLL